MFLSSSSFPRTGWSPHSKCSIVKRERESVGVRRLSGSPGSQCSLHTPPGRAPSWHGGPAFPPSHLFPAPPPGFPQAGYTWSKQGPCLRGYGGHLLSCSTATRV
ncbi:hypothetical protein C7M84_014167 [Penaeus vannamei]|uniref:Uncharacterized protein n=1 Tax=Penaeus vannamei TaxID=6689 RepID=A0A3R7M5J5_PENVA|nr:hypothetical protein C7M84_014167 [Penaeus vannamei]